MSAIKLGDKVAFLDENLEGTVTTINGNIAGVTVEDDFEIPVPVSQLVRISENGDKVVEEVVENTVNKGAATHGGIYLAFDRINENLCELKLYNSDSEELLFAFYESKKEEIYLKKHGKLLINETIELGRHDLEQFSTWPKFYFQVLKINKQPDKFSQPIDLVLTFSAREFHGSFKYTFFLNKQAYLFNLNNEKLPMLDLQKLRQKDFTEKHEEKILFDKKPAAVIDLHIEKLVSNVSSLNPAEMIAMQMEAFTKSLEMAHVHKMKSIVFIHGVGNHFLKNKIRNYLALQKQPVTSYRDAEMLKFGGGATEVFLN